MERSRHARIGLPPEPQSAPLARGFIRDVCERSQLAPDLGETAALLVTELVTNSLLHTGTEAVLEVRLDPRLDGRPERLRVSVADGDPVLPRFGLHPAATDEHGRGLLLVAALATRWGVEPATGSGKTVWFELDGPR